MITSRFILALIGAALLLTACEEDPAPRDAADVRIDHTHDASATNRDVTTEPDAWPAPDAAEDVALDSAPANDTATDTTNDTAADSHTTTPDDLDSTQDVAPNLAPEDLGAADADAAATTDTDDPGIDDDAGPIEDTTPEPTLPCSQSDGIRAPVPPSEVHCPAGWLHDRDHHLCVREDEALGPFSGAMIETCRSSCNDGCDAAIWPVAMARGIRGTARCMPGTALTARGMCASGEHAFGPFTPELVAACERAGGGSACGTMRWNLAFAERLVEASQVTEGPWRWILPVDHGLRTDGLGAGHFGAARLNNAGGHSGIDVLAASGTELLSPCAGYARSGVATGFGRWVQIVCRVPAALSGGHELWAAILYAHLSSDRVSGGRNVTAGEVVGAVGKSGNAAAAAIRPHVHFEIAIHGSRDAALAETHASANHADNVATQRFDAAALSACWTPEGLTPRTGPRRKGRRPDPFMVLACLVGDKPTPAAPPSWLQSIHDRWSTHYLPSAPLRVDASPLAGGRRGR
jgi:hypothetical protein